MEDPWPTVDLHANDDEVRTVLGQALEKHGHATVFSPSHANYTAFLARLVTRIMPRISEYLGEYPISWDDGWQLNVDIACPHINLFTFFSRSRKSVVITAGVLMEFWSRGRIRRASEATVPDASETFYVRPGPDTILRIIPRMTVGHYMEVYS